MKFKSVYTIVLLLFPGVINAQIPNESTTPKYILRNQNFIDKREGGKPVNFAKNHIKSLSQMLPSTSSINRRGKTWTPKGPFGYEKLAGVGRVNTMTFHPTDTNTWFICVAQGGLWKTTNAGKSWVSISSNLPILRTSHLSIHPKNAEIMYVAMGDFEYLGHNLYANGSKRTSHYGIGIYKTINGGKTWSPTGLSFKELDFEASLLARVLIHPTNPDTLIAVGQTGCHLSYDAGATWNKTNSKLFWDLKQDPENPNTLFATTGYIHSYKYGEASIVRSYDFGKTWTTSNSAIPLTGKVQRVKLSISPSDPNYIYAIACDLVGGFYGFYRSTDRGKNFTTRTDNSYSYNLLNNSLDGQPGGQGRYDLAICVDKNDKNKVLIGGINIWQTTDGGQNFKPITYWLLNYYSTSLHADVHQIKQHPTNNSYFACHDGGISRAFTITPDDIYTLKNDYYASTEWIDYTEGLNITSYYRLSINPENGTEMMVGAQDNSTAYTDGSTFFNLTGGDGMESVFQEEDFVYTSSQNGVINVLDKYLDDFQYVDRIQPPNNEIGEWTTPFVKANNMLYIGYGNIYPVRYNALLPKITNFGTLPGQSFPSPITALDVESKKGMPIYMAKRGYSSLNVSSEVWSSLDGKTWKKSNSALPGHLYPSYIEMSQAEPSKAWITYAGFDSSKKVYYTKDAGVNWSNITYNLPNTSVNCIVHQHDGSNNVYVGTDHGVFYLNKDSTKWVEYNQGFPKVIVSELEIDTINDKLVAATFGRGLWEVDILDYTHEPDPVKLNKSITQNTTISLFPNPVTAESQLKISNVPHGEYKIEIINIVGSTIFHRKLDIHANNYSQKLPTSSLPMGEYFLILSNGKDRIVERFIKE